ncbi:DUF4238 domain-containing protein [Termitidicoccus mucosus]|uniref:DUF4238 domain-containing protein n=1 Tax=Termitidicoccus mucosus TaxID=1184151 RepID=A0A178IKH7_9BACT|nr:hypothetical protein AW736_07890 [Opitutaceae bacterium TSB47]
MPAYKRQHFLPCVYLKNFSPDGAKATRDSKVWRIDEKRTAFVPVKSQCAGDYLFSKIAAKKSENEFQAIEDGYAAAVAKIWSGGDPTVFEYFALIVAVLDLYARNISHENHTGHDGAHAYQLRTTSLLDRLIAGNQSRETLPQDEIYARLKRFWDVRLFLTPPGREIVTSDHPVLCFNWGEGDAMDFLLMPVTPGACAAVFDKRTTHTSGHRLTESDGTNLFRFSATHAHSCLYTASEPDQGAIDAARRLLQQRVKPRTITDAEKWSLDLIVPPRRDVFSFICPQGKG